MNDSLAARHGDPEVDAEDPPDAVARREPWHPDEQETASQEMILEVLGEGAAALGGTDRLFAEVLIDAADDLLETLQRERAENWEFRFPDPARASAIDILEQLRARTDSLERISAGCHGLVWHIRRAQELGALAFEPCGALAPAGWFVELMQGLAGTPRCSAAGPVVRHPAWALTALLERFRGPDEVRHYLARICAQSHGAVERLLADHMLPLVQSLRAAQFSYSLHSRAPRG